VLVIHGKVGAVESGWDDANRALSEAFLGLAVLPESNEQYIDGRPMYWWGEGQRCVVWSRALNGANVTDAYLAGLHELIRQYV